MGRFERNLKVLGKVVLHIALLRVLCAELPKRTKLVTKYFLGNWYKGEVLDCREVWSWLRRVAREPLRPLNQFRNWNV